MNEAARYFFLYPAVALIVLLWGVVACHIALEWRTHTQELESFKACVDAQLPIEDCAQILGVKVEVIDVE